MALPTPTPAAMTDRICAITLERPAGRGWWLCLGLSLALTLVLVVAVAATLAEGLGLWGIEIPVAWGLAIINYVWWIAIASGGTLVSAVFYLAGAEWRAAVTRIAETMMLCAGLCAALFPVLHLGRPWLFYWLFPWPNTLDLYPQFRSPLLWDFFAILTYLGASALFWYLGLIPDLATLRDRAATPAGRFLYGLLALGWRGEAGQWRAYQGLYLLFAGLMTPLVVSVHSVVGLDFAGGLTPGWHSAQLPPFFVFGAMLSGLAMVVILVTPIRAAYGLHDLITSHHLDILGKLLLAASFAIAYAYVLEMFAPFYGGDAAERQLALARLSGPLAPLFWTTVAANVLAPQLLWFGRARLSPVTLFMVSLVVIVGMWLERYLIVVTSLERDYAPALWRTYDPTAWDWALLAGSVGLFLTGITLFLRLLPIVSMSETRELLARRGDRP